jgi:uncharacterized protein
VRWSLPVKLEGDYLFDAAIADVWAALFDPEVLAAAMPGCEKLDLVDSELVGEMTIKIGPISGKFSGKVRFEDKVEPTGFKMFVDGKGGPGFVKATATMALATEGSGTRLRYTADAQIGGKIASVGERLVDASARAISKQSLDNLHENVKIRSAAKAPPPPAPVIPSIPDVRAMRPPETPTAPVTPAPEKPAYVRADANEMAKTVAKVAAKTMLPTIIGVLVVIAIVVWLLLR